MRSQIGGSDRRDPAYDNCILFFRPGNEVVGQKNADNLFSIGEVNVGNFALAAVHRPGVNAIAFGHILRNSVAELLVYVGVCDLGGGLFLPCSYIVSSKHFFVPFTLGPELFVQFQNLTFEPGDFASPGDIVVAVAVVFHKVFAKGIRVTIKMIIRLSYLIEFLGGGVKTSAFYKLTKSHFQILLDYFALPGYNGGGRGKAPGSPLLGEVSGAFEGVAHFLCLDLVVADYLSRFFNRLGVRFNQPCEHLEELIELRRCHLVHYLTSFRKRGSASLPYMFIINDFLSFVKRNLKCFHSYLKKYN